MYSFKSEKLKFFFVSSFGASKARRRCCEGDEEMYSRGLRLQAPAHKGSLSGSLWPQQRNHPGPKAAATS